MRRAVDPPDRTPRLPYSAAVVSEGPLAFISGQGPVDPATGEFVLGTFEEQTRLTLANLRAVADAVGGSLSQAVKVNVYLRDMANFARFNDLYREAFPEPRPARTTVQSDLPGFEIEIDAVLVLDPPDPPRRRAEQRLE